MFVHTIYLAARMGNVVKCKTNVIADCKIGLELRCSDRRVEAYGLIKARQQ